MIIEKQEDVTRAVLEDFERRVPGQRAGGATTLELPEGGLMEALRRAEDSDAWGEELAERAARNVQRHPSGALLLSDLPDADVGEAAAQAVARDLQGLPRLESLPPASAPHFEAAAASALPMSEPPPVPRLASVPPAEGLRPQSGVSFEALWPVPERGTVRELEAALSQPDFERAITLADQLVSRGVPAARSESTSGSPG